MCAIRIRHQSPETDQQGLRRRPEQPMDQQRTVSAGAGMPSYLFMACSVASAQIGYSDIIRDDERVANA